MINMHAAAALALAALTLTACEKTAQTPAPQPAPTASRPAANPLDLQPTHPRPTADDITLDLKPGAADAEKTDVTWTVKVDSTGWSMKTESVLEEDHMGKMTARIYAVISEPQPGDKVEKTPQTLTMTHQGKQKLEKAELSIKHTVRDSKPTYAQYYTVMKTVGY